MPWHAVYQEADGALVSVGTVLAEELPPGLATREYPEPPAGVWDPAARGFVPAPPSPPAPISRLDLLRRFTQAERIAIRSSTDPIVIDFGELLGLAQEVRLDDPDTVAGIGYLEVAGLLSPGRAAEILGG